MQKRERNVRLFGAVLLLAGTGLSVWGAIVAVQAWLTTTWPTTQGAIIAASVEERVNVNASAVEEDKLDYVPAIQYTFGLFGLLFGLLFVLRPDLI